MLEFQAVSKDYIGPGEVVHAIKKVSLSLNGGELTAIYGPSGSGKTTLLMLAAGLLCPDQGTVYFQGKDLSTLSERQMADHRLSNLGFIYQNFNLLPGLNALDNIAIPLMLHGQNLREAHPRAMEIADLFGLTQRTSHMPDRLSGGEQQRVAMARALVCTPQLILADEPTGNLDIERSRQVISTLSSLAHDLGVAVVVVTHDIEAANHADVVLTLRDGVLKDGFNIDQAISYQAPTIS